MYGFSNVPSPGQDSLDAMEWNAESLLMYIDECGICDVISTVTNTVSLVERPTSSQTIIVRL